MQNGSLTTIPAMTEQVPKLTLSRVGADPWCCHKTPCTLRASCGRLCHHGYFIATGQSFQVSCVVQGFRVSDGNTNWCRIASSLSSNVYYASADAFYNNDATSGSLNGTPYVDPEVPSC